MAKRGRKISLSGGLHTKLPPPEEFSPAKWRTNEILLMLFAHMKMQERTYKDLQTATRTHERALLEWRKYGTPHGGNSKGPGLIQILNALHMVGLTLDVVPL